MTSDNEEFAAWLRDRARAAGYDIDGPRTGGKAKLADDAGVSRGQVGRALAGEVIPDIHSQRGLAKALRIPMLEMLVSSGYLRVDDMAEAIREWSVQGDNRFAEYPAADLRPEDALRQLGLTDPADQSLILAMVERMRELHRVREEARLRLAEASTPNDPPPNAV